MSDRIIFCANATGTYTGLIIESIYTRCDLSMICFAMSATMSFLPRIKVRGKLQLESRAKICYTHR